MSMQLINAINNRDGAAMAKMAGGEADKVINSEAEQLVDSLFRQLKQIFPASVSTSLKGEEQEKTTKRHWIAAFAENGITTREQISAGFRHARASNSDFWPSPGKFIAWCKEADLSAAGLPGEDELYISVMTYCARRGGYNSAEDYPWKTNAEYWMVTGLYSMMRAGNLSEAELRVKCRSELRKMSQRIESGEEIPEPRKQLLKLSVPSTPAKALEGVAMLRATLKSGRAS